MRHGWDLIPLLYRLKNIGKNKIWILVPYDLDIRYKKEKIGAARGLVTASVELREAIESDLRNPKAAPADA